MRWAESESAAVGFVAATWLAVRASNQSEREGEQIVFGSLMIFFKGTRL